MAKNITLMGASYSDVPAVTLPQTGGGTARFDDASVTTATAADVASGKVFLAADGQVTTGTASGGGGVDIPTFTITWNTDWTSAVSVTCNKTYAECLAIYLNGDWGAWLIETDTTGAEPYGSSLSLIKVDEQQNLVYSLFAVDCLPSYDVYYSQNGSISVVKPSGFRESLNITANGSYYSSGNAITEVNVAVPIPTPTLITKNITANGTYNASTDNADGYSSVTVNVSGGGGASNFVTGSFIGTTAGAALEVSIPYTGNGYPISILVFPAEGPYNQDSGSFYSLVQQYAIASFYMVKNQTDTTPDYSSSELYNTGTGGYRYKSSKSSSITYSQGGFGGLTNSMRFMDRSASVGSGTFLYLRAKNQMSVFIASTGYGFAPNIEYTYQIVYSS